MTATPYVSADPRAGRFEAFVDRLRDDVYPEPPSEQHTELARHMWGVLKQVVPMPPGTRVLDVGCGQGLSLIHI